MIPASRHKVITAQELVAKLNIRGFYNSDTPAHLREIVRAMSNDSRQRFVSFITASTVLLGFRNFTRQNGNFADTI